MEMDMVKNRISVVIPVYNGALWIRECVESVLAQTWKELEILVMDDHSTDGTTQIIQELAGQDHRVRLISRNRKGVSSARNEGVEKSSGQYVTFLDADDKLDEKMLETLAGLLQRENSDMAVCGYYQWVSGRKSSSMTQEGRNLPETGSGEVPGHHFRTVERELWLSDYLLRHYTHCWGILYKKTLIENTRFREELTIGEDMMFLMDLLPKVFAVSVTDYKGYYYRVNPSGVTLRPFVPAYMDEIKSWKLAADKIARDYPRCRPRAESILAVSAVLVAGKIARLSFKDMQKYREYVAECRETVKEALKVKGAARNLPAGYRIKTTIFRCCPWVYLKAYHLWKNR